MKTWTEILDAFAPKYGRDLTPQELAAAYEGYCPFCAIRFVGRDAFGDMDNAEYADIVIGQPDEPSLLTCSCCRCGFVLTKGSGAGSRVEYDDQPPGKLCVHLRTLATSREEPQ